MSVTLFVALLFLIVFFNALLTFSAAILFNLFWSKAMAVQKEMLASLTDDEDLDEVYEQNQQLIDPLPTIND